jgi:tetratricopeptide (TPR) repeat protein
MSKNCLIFLCALTFCACAFAEDHYWCEGQTVEIEKCPTNEAIKNITVELAKGTDGKIIPTSILFGVKVKTGSYELDLNVDKWLAWSRGEAKKDSLVWFTVPQGVWETFGQDGKLTLTIKDNKGSLTDPVNAVAVMSDCADWPGEKDCRSYFMRGVDLMGSGDYDEAIKYFNECMETYEADVWRFAHYFIRKCKLQKELEKMAQDEKLQTLDNYYKAGVYAMHGGMRKEAMELFMKALDTTPKNIAVLASSKAPVSNEVEMAEKAFDEYCKKSAKVSAVRKFAFLQAEKPEKEFKVDDSVCPVEAKEITLLDLTAVVFSEVTCASNAVFFTVADYKKPKGSRYVRRYFKESSALDNYLNLEREKAAAVRYEKGEEVRDLLFVKENEAFPYLELRPEFKQHVLGILTIKDVPDTGKDQRLLVFDLPSAMIGETYPDEGEDILSFEAK